MTLEREFSFVEGSIVESGFELPQPQVYDEWQTERIYQNHESRVGLKEPSLLALTADGKVCDEKLIGTIVVRLALERLAHASGNRRQNEEHDSHEESEVFFCLRVCS